MKAEDRKGLRTWIEIDRKAIKHNYDIFRSLVSKKTKLMAVVKSNAYGHGLLDFSREMEKLGADFLGVDSVLEALALRKEGIKTPILVLGYTLPEMIEEAIAKNISFAVSTFETLEFLAKQKKLSPKIHIKIDTGMHRQGFLESDMKRVSDILKKNSNIICEGLFTHFASAKNPAFPHDTKKQIEVFKKWIACFQKEGWKPIIHAAATGGTQLYPEAHFDMVRVGMGLYGLPASRETKAATQDGYVLMPILTWKTLASEIKKIPRGDRVGYDFTETLSGNTTIAVCPVGYWHGYPRALSGIGRVLVNGKEVKILGRVSMDMIVIDITSIPNVRVGDEIILLGSDSKSEVSAEGIATLLDASWYELVTRINPLIKRIYR
jgi:alanine racemase